EVPGHAIERGRGERARDHRAHAGVLRRIIREKQLRPHRIRVMPGARCRGEAAPVLQARGYMLEARQHHHVFARQAHHRRIFAQAIVHRIGIAHRLVAEQVGIEFRYGPGHVYPAAVTPPSTCRISPLMNEACWLSRNTHASALSVSLPSRRSGMVRLRRSYSSRLFSPSAPGVGTDAGAMALTRTLRGPSSAASTLVSVTMAPFTRLYAAVFG